MPAELYFIDRLNPKEHIQGIVFVGAAVYISLGVANNVLYTLVQYVGVQSTRQSRTKRRLWALKAAVSWLFRLLLLCWTLVTLWLLTQFGILLVVSITVDPYRPFMILGVLGTVVGYANIALSSATSMQQQLKQEIQTRYLEKHHLKLAVPAHRKKVVARMNQLIVVELDRLGLSFQGIVASVLLGTVGVAMVLAVVLVAQGLFYTSVGSDIGGLVSTLTPCAVLIANKLSHTHAQKRQLEGQVEGLEKTVTKTIEQTEKGDKAIQKNRTGAQ